MKKLLFAVLFASAFLKLNAQWEVSASMGLDLKYSPSYRDYINFSFAPSGDKLNSFTTAVDFSGEAGYLLSKNFQLGFEYSILIDSYNTSLGPGGVYDISYVSHRPSLLAYYVLSGNGYKFKFGGGMGLRSVSLNEKIIDNTHYSTSGVGFVAKAEGNTLLGDNLYALIGIDLRYDFPGELSTSSGKKIVNFGTGENVNMNSLGVGIKLGITYTF